MLHITPVHFLASLGQLLNTIIIICMVYNCISVNGTIITSSSSIIIVVLLLFFFVYIISPARFVIASGLLSMQVNK
jgi:hypothetical protein